MTDGYPLVFGQTFFKIGQKKIKFIGDFILKFIFSLLYPFILFMRSYTVWIARVWGSDPSEVTGTFLNIITIDV